jgi:hypothetical protein
VAYSRAALVVFVVVALGSALLAGKASAQSSLERYDREACAPYGGLSGISKDFPYSAWFLRLIIGDTANNLSRGCKQYCPQCIRYCYLYSIACGTQGKRLARYSQVQPFVSQHGDHPTYTSESQQLAELAQIQKQEASSNFWRPLSPYPQLLIFGVFLSLSWVSRRGRGKDEVYYGWNGPLILYFALSLLTFNTSSDSLLFMQIADQYLFFHSWLFVFAVIFFFATNVAPLVRGWHYLFVKHPAADIVNSAVRSGTPIHGQSLARALWVSPQDVFQWRPRWYYEHQAEKARKLKDKLDRDADLARAAIARERARAELRDEQQASAEDKREQVWRGRTFR